MLPSPKRCKNGDVRKIVYIWFQLIKTHNSQIWTVIGSHGDVSDFQHLQGLISNFIAIRIQNVSVFSSTFPVKIPGRINKVM